MAGLDYNNGEWIPNYAWEKSEDFLSWLSRKNPVFPVPAYNVGDTIDFKWSNAIARRGKITHISLIFDHKENSYIGENNITYDVYWNGHSRWVKVRDIINE